MNLALFNEELKNVAPDREFSFETDLTFGKNEWSVSGFHITAGSEAALEHGASEALYQMGYRFYDPMTTYRPASIPDSGLTLSRQQFRMPYVRVFENYGRGKLAEAEHARWKILNCIDDRRRPVGHAWGSIINAIEAQDGFFMSNPSTVIRHEGNGPIAFNLGLRGAEREKMVNRIAAYLAQNLNEEGRHRFDPEDGDKYSTDEVVDFSNEVVARIRETVPDALLGIYAYAGHRAPPTRPCPHLYVQVALGFDDLGIGYAEMVRRWVEKAGEVALRGYGDIAAWSGFLPCRLAIDRNNYFSDQFKDYLEGGADSLNMETSGNWLKNIVSHYLLIRFARTGDTDYSNLVEEIVERSFEGDPKVGELFEYWGRPENRFNQFTLLRSMQIVNGMRESDYKERYEQYLNFCFRHWDLTPNHAANGVMKPDTPPDQMAVYFSRLEENLRRSRALGESGYLHSYGYSRRLANANVINNGRPDLAFSQNPHWMRFPKLSSHSEYLSAFETLSLASHRPAQFDQSDIADLVLVETAPSGAAASQDGDAVDFVTRGPAKFIFAGPGSVIVTYEEAWRGSQTLEFGPGLHSFLIARRAITRWNRGYLFLSGFPEVRLDPPPTQTTKGEGHRWAYIPRLTDGAQNITSGSRLTIFDAEGRKDIMKVAVPDIVPGVVRVDKTLTRGTHQLITANPYFSCSAYKMLMPRKLAEAEFPDGLTVRPGS